MMRSVYRGLIFVLVITLLGLSPRQASAKMDLYSAGEFQYAFHINPLGKDINAGLTKAVNLGPDWLLVDFDWRVWYPAGDTLQDLQSLDVVMETAEKAGIKVCLRIHNPPEWAVSASGPDVQRTTALLFTLKERYPTSFRAVELFAGANTSLGWGSAPSPKAYFALLQDIQNVIVQEEWSLRLIAGGLTIVPSPAQTADMSDIEFLEGLYSEGFQSLNATLSIQLTDLSKDIFSLPQEEGERVLLHVDEIQKMMEKFGDEANPVWVTAITFDGSDNGNFQLSDTCVLLRSRLFVGLVTPVAVNPVSSVPKMMVVSVTIM